MHLSEGPYKHDACILGSVLVFPPFVETTLYLEAHGT